MFLSQIVSDELSLPI